MSKMHKICFDDSFCLELEEEQGKLFAHCEVYELTPTTIRKIKGCWKEVKKQLSDKGCDSLYSYTANIKFAQAIDDEFERIAEVEYKGKNLEVLKWELV